MSLNKNKIATALALLAVSFILVFQNCSGFTVGNPFKEDTQNSTSGNIEVRHSIGIKPFPAEVLTAENIQTARFCVASITVYNSSGQQQSFQVRNWVNLNPDGTLVRAVTGLDILPVRAELLLDGTVCGGSSYEIVLINNDFSGDTQIYTLESAIENGPVLPNRPWNYNLDVTQLISNFITQ